MRTFTMIAASLALLTATACTETEAPVQTADPTPNEASLASHEPINTASSTAIYLECKTDDERSVYPDITYRIDPSKKTWSRWIKADEDGGPNWQVIYCDISEYACTFEDTVFSLNIGLDVWGYATINRVTGKMTKQWFPPPGDLQIWEYMCTPVDNPANAREKKF